MTDLTNTRHELATLQTYETRIDLYKEQVIGGYLGIGRTLLDAKAAGVVPHGQWETWATQTTGMSIRNVQRCMQAAREIDDQSPLARLDMSKALLLLSSGLGEETRDAIGTAAAEEQIPVSELQERIRQAKAEARAAERDIIALERSAERSRHADEIAMTRKQVNQARQAEMDRQAAAYRQQLADRDAELAEAQAKAAEAEERAKASSATEIAQLRARLDKADSDRRTAQQELLTLKSSQASAAAAGRDQQAGLTADRFARATRTYLMEVGELPYMGTALANTDAGVRDAYLQQLRRIADWLKLAQMALSTQIVEVEDDLDTLLCNGLSDLEVFRA